MSREATGGAGVGARRLLLVEDDEAQRRLLARRLSRAGYAVAEAASGSECLERVAEHAPDLLLLDYGLPDGSATDLVDRLRKAGHELPFIVVTGQGNERVAVEMMHHGARDYVVKDQQLLERLPAVVEQVLARVETERRLARAEDALRRSEAKYRRIIDNLGEGYFLYEHGVDGVFTFVGASVREVLGYAPEEFCTHYTQTLTDHPLNRRAREYTEGSIRGERQPPYVVEVHHRDGAPRKLEVQEIPVFDAAGRVEAVEGLARDVTEAIAAAETLRLQGAALESTSSATVITDTDATIRWVNRAFCEVTGYAREELIGKNPRLLKSGQHDRAFYRAMWSRLLAGEVWEGEIVNRRKDGSLLREQMSIAPVPNENGEIRHFVGVKRDVTRERELERRLEQASRLEAVGQLAGGIAHDFNNLLTIISGFTGLALGELPEGSEPHAAMEEVAAAAERAAALTGQLLAFSRRQVVQPRDVDPNQLVRDLERSILRLLGEDLELVLDLAEGAPVVRIDPGKLEQVLINLAVNARDAMPGGGRLTVRTRRIDASEWAGADEIAEGAHLRLEVSDTGTGMDADTLARAFEPFFTTKGVGKGTGLGLATVYGIIKQADGDLRVTSAPGEGTCVEILLPCAGGDAAEAARPAVESRDPAPGGGELILLVEDDAPLLGLTRRFLEGAGYGVVAASDGEEALRVSAELGDEIALVLSDVVMPRINGGELVETLRRDRPDLKVLFLSGYAGDVLDAHGVLASGISLVDKPFTREVLLDAVRRALEPRA